MRPLSDCGAAGVRLLFEEEEGLLLLEELLDDEPREDRPLEEDDLDELLEEERAESLSPRAWVTASRSSCVRDEGAPQAGAVRDRAKIAVSERRPSMAPPGLAEQTPATARLFDRRRLRGRFSRSATRYARDSRRKELQMPKVAMVDLAARHASVGEEVERRVIEVLRGGAYVGGATVAAAEAAAAGFFGREAGVGVASGTDAIMLALQALGLRVGEEVIVPALSFFATAGAVAAIGLVPVIADVRADGLIDPEAVAAVMSGRTRAIIPVHLFGNQAPLLDFGVPVVDDAAQAVGAGPGCSVGVLTALSVYPTKTWGAAGEGGFVLGERGELLERVRALGNHGGSARGYDTVAGWGGRNSRLDALQAAVLLGHAPAIAGRVARRRALAARYDAGVPSSVRPLARSPGSAVHQYVVLVERRDAVRRVLVERGIESRVYYERPLHQEPALLGRGYAPNAEHLSARMLALPLRSSMSEEDVDAVLAALWEVVE